MYPRYRKMSWGVGSVFLRLKKRHQLDSNLNTLDADEVDQELDPDSVASAGLNTLEADTVDQELAPGTVASAGLVLGVSAMGENPEADPEVETLINNDQGSANQSPAL